MVKGAGLRVGMAEGTYAKRRGAWREEEEEESGAAVRASADG